MTFQFKIQLKDITQPPVWRRVLVPAQFNFLKFHEVIQAAFGWYDCHLFQFSPGGYGSTPRIIVPDREFDEGKVENAKKMKLSEIFINEKQTYTYIYDFGDDWHHKITLEKIIAEKTLRADCTGGKGECPPEDCGGPGGYANLLETLNNPSNPEFEELRDWLGLEEDDVWDVNEFDLAETSDIVRAI